MKERRRRGKLFPYERGGKEFRKQVCAEEDGRSLCTAMHIPQEYPPTLPLQNEPSGNEGSKVFVNAAMKHIYRTAKLQQVNWRSLNKEDCAHCMLADARGGRDWLRIQREL